VGLYQRLLPAVEGALQAAVTDAITETRNTGRVALAAYTAVLPERGVALVKRFDGPVQVRHRLAAAQSKPAGWFGGTRAGAGGTLPLLGLLMERGLQCQQDMRLQHRADISPHLGSMHMLCLLWIQVPSELSPSIMPLRCCRPNCVRPLPATAVVPTPLLPAPARAQAAGPPLPPAGARAWLRRGMRLQHQHLQQGRQQQQLAGRVVTTGATPPAAPAAAPA
jgi:hypothetical protein